MTIHIVALYLCMVPAQCELSDQSSRCCDDPLRGHALCLLLPRLLHCLGEPDWTDVETLVRMEPSSVLYLPAANSVDLHTIVLTVNWPKQMTANSSFQ